MDATLHRRALARAHYIIRAAIGAYGRGSAQHHDAIRAAAAEYRRIMNGKG